MCRCLPVALTALALTACHAQQAGFHPVLDRSEVTPRAVRPGGALSVSFQFRNAGDSTLGPACRIFLHFEDPVLGCNKIVWQADHDPSEPTSFWLPGETILDGPLHVVVPDGTPAGAYKVHVGVFDAAGGGRLLDTDAGQVTVDPNAPATPPVLGPEPLSAAEVAKREAEAVKLDHPVTLDGEGYRFAIDPASGRWVLTDTRANVAWTSDPLHDRFGRLLLRGPKGAEAQTIRDLKVAPGNPGSLVLAKPLVTQKGEATGLTLELSFAVETAAPGGLAILCNVRGTSDWKVERVWLLDSALPATEAAAGRTVEPFRLGRGITAADGLPVVDGQTTYDGASMQMLSLERAGASLLVTWDDVDVRYQVRRAWLDSPRVPGARVLLHTLELWNGAGRVHLRPLGKGDYVTAARAYRDVAVRRGWRVTRGDYAKQRPEVQAMAGAADFKPFVFSRTVTDSVWNKSGREQTWVGYSFEETAQLAEHWRNDLGIDKAMVVLAGWIHRGYDNQHPDILPSAPECGGNDALSAAGKRIKACGYLFGLHDNYQDMYADAPSFDAKYLRRGANGKPLMGGNWAGGQAWQVRPQSQVELAQRNLPEVAGRFGPSIYFIDTVFAWGLVDSQAPGDVWDRAVDLDYKSKLCAYARKVTGAFGSEEGREWAVPVSDYLEGLYGHKFDTPPGEVLPIFEIAYHDCVSTYTHQSTRIGPDDAKHVLDHVTYGEMPLYEFGSHLYWQGAEAEAVPLRVSAAVKGTGPRTFEVTYTWEALGKVAADYSAFVHFTHPRSERPEQIAIQNDHALPATSTWQAGSRHTDGPHAITVPEGYSGDFELRLGLLSKDGERQALSMGRGDGGRYLLGIVHAGPDGVTFTPLAPGGVNRPFARKEGWSRDLCTTDRFIKNTYEVLSWVHRLSFGVPLDEHHVAGQVERTRFGPDLRVVCNYGAEPVALDAGPVLGRVTLPQDGFAVWSPTFVAVHATAAGGRSYATPALYTARSLDGQPLEQSARVRVYHGCGGPALGLKGKTVNVDREAEVSLR